MKYIQAIGRSLMLPVAVLPAAAILAGIGNWITAVNEDSVIGQFIINAGTSILDNIAILFAVGVAIGMSREKDGAAALSGLVGFLVITQLLSSENVAGMMGVAEDDAPLAYSGIDNVFIGIIVGLVAAALYNRFSHVKLPDALAFFSGKRLVPILTAAASVGLAGIFFFLWPVVYNGLVTFGTAISGLGPAGAGLYGFFNRLLIPTGLHHALNQVFWFDLAGINDIGNYWSSEGEPGVTGRYMAGFFPIMMFGLPAAALAMYHTAKTTQRKQAAALLLAAGIASFFTGVTEPLEFSFMFLAPLLFVVHAALTGLSLFIAASFEWMAGFGFSAGLVDFVLGFVMPLAQQPYMLIVQGLVFAAIYYFLFRFLIIKFDLKTPGRQEETGTEETSAGEEDADSELSAQSARIIAGLGGAANIASIDSCATRLRLEVHDMDAVDEGAIRRTGVPGTNIVGKHSIHVIIGPSVQFTEEEVRKQVEKEQ
ncbi:N-acetylglucosamine-specific PTS transporter subunit IIBC [Alkalicoccus luteus]|uniref:N-acetylglucosamine-specific PTS transporter subunit IIBC n=1 Tax=Alkalicoccus luteus TaxID=1237094 RepID=UPI004034BCC8